MYNWIGIILCLIALAIVGLSSVWAEQDKVVDTIDQQKHPKTISDVVNPAPTNGAGAIALQVFGICMIILGQVVCASQYVIEEFLLRPPFVAPPMVLVGLEGFWGLIVMVLFVMPGAQLFISGDDVGGVYENSSDSVYKIENSSGLFWLNAIFFVSVLIYNIVGVTVTAEASAIHHTFLDASRTLIIWIASVFIYYFVDESYGEPLTNYSWLQAIGFAILVLGQVVYDGLVRIPGISYVNVDPHSPVMSYSSRLTIPHSVRAGSIFSSPGNRFVSNEKFDGRSSVGSFRLDAGSNTSLLDGSN